VIIAVDFDGTVVEHEFPEIGKPAPYAFHWLKRFKELGAILILWTMRNDREGDAPYLTAAAEFCKAQGVEFDHLNENPGQASWSQSPKAYAHVYIDVAAFGCPLRDNPRMGGRPFADWRRIGPAMQAMLLNERGGACPECGGWGLQYPDPDSGTCPRCKGTGEAPAECAECLGTGNVPCGAGTVPCPTCRPDDLKALEEQSGPFPCLGDGDE